MKTRTALLAAVLFISFLGIGGQALAMAFSSPPDWMPMTMLSISFNPDTNKLAIESPTIAAPLATNTDMMGMPGPGIAVFDPAQPYGVLNDTAFSRRFGWWDANEMTPDEIIPAVQAYYGPGANIWIQSLKQSPGLNTYQAVGDDGLQTGNLYPPIFGAAGSSTKWRWDGMMDHNTNAVPFSYLTKPNQFFSAYYKIYVGDESGNELLQDSAGNPVASAATTTTWFWQGPSFVFTTQTGIAADTLLESDVFTHTGDPTPITITGGAYEISSDGGLTWGDWTAEAGTINTNDRVKVRQTSSANPGATTTATLSIPTAYGPGTFCVTTLGTDTTPSAFSFSSQTGVATGAAIESGSVTVAGINAPTAISISAGGEYAISTDGGATWGDWNNLSGTVANSNRVKVRLVSSSDPGVTTTVSLTIGGIAGAFVVTTGNPDTPSLFFGSVTNAPANTSVSGMPFYVTSNAITADADSTISVAGGIAPQYQVSTDGGISWSAWLTTAPATVAAGNLVRVRVVPATLPFTTSTTNLNLGSTVAGFSVTTGYANPPSWMPMAMLNVAFDATTGTLSVQDESTHPSFSSGALPLLNYVPTGSYDPAEPWDVLNGGVAISRQLGWDDNTALHGNGITVAGGILYQVRTLYPEAAGIWIECLSKSEGLETYHADGMFGVGGTGNSASGTPQVYSDATTGLPIVYENNYYGIFGTDGSSTKWQWNGTMIHNVYAVPAAFITQPDQIFTATYRVYIGDSQGNDIAPSAATTEVWTWKGPATLPDTTPDAFSFTSQTGVDPTTIYESNAITVTGLDAPAAISISTGGSYSISTDNGISWGAWASSVGTIANNNQVKVRNTASATADTEVITTLTIGGATGSFSLTTNAYSAPPSWSPMTMLNISYDSGTGKLAIVAQSGSAALSTLVPAGTYDPAKPWSVLDGTSFSRRLGWNPAAGFNAATVQAAFGPTASIWIERVSASDGLQTFQAVGKYGVNSNNTTTVDPAASGYAPIFGTNGSSTKWQWDYKMDHNANAVPASYITSANQLFTATYRIYVGDSLGNDIAPSAATTTTWSWQGPATVPDTSTLSFTVGWNLVSSSIAVPASAFSDASTFDSIWKWTGTNWMVNLPDEETVGAYAGSKGFGVLTAIAPGEGFWVNSKTATAVPLAGTAVSGPLTFSSGWNLSGLKGTAAMQVTEINAAQPGIVSIWKWTGTTWAVYLPNESTPGTYAQSKDFGVLSTINPGEGFWVNVP